VHPSVSREKSRMHITHVSGANDSYFEFRH